MRAACPGRLLCNLYPRFAEYNSPSDPVGKVARYLESLPGIATKKVFCRFSYSAYAPTVRNAFDPGDYLFRPDLNRAGLMHLLKTGNFDIFVVDQELYKNLETRGHLGDGTLLRRFLSQHGYSKLFEAGPASVYEKEPR